MLVPAMLLNPTQYTTDVWTFPNFQGHGRLNQLLLLKTSLRNGKWAFRSSYWSHQSLGSILFVDRSRRDVKMEDITAICNLIEEFAVPSS